MKNYDLSVRRFLAIMMLFICKSAIGSNDLPAVTSLITEESIETKSSGCTGLPDIWSQTESELLNQYVTSLNAKAGFSFQPEFLSILNQYILAGQKLLSEISESDSSLIQHYISEFYHYIFVDLKLLRMQSQVNDWLGIIEIVLNPVPDSINHKMAGYIRQMTTTLSRSLLKAHPGLELIRSNNLRQSFTGQSIDIAVVDTFDDSEMELLRQRYPDATIKEIKNFGNPVRLNHGVIVIEKILEIAPGATIYPVSYESGFAEDAADYLTEQNHIFLINYSRGFPDFTTGGSELRQKFRTLSENKIIVKAIGNHGLTLDGSLTQERSSRNLDPVGSFDQDDIHQISFFLKTFDVQDLFPGIILALNAKIFDTSLSLTTGAPGHQALAQSVSLAVPADGLWSEVSRQFESGTSFAAPQITGVLALLSQSLMKQGSSEHHLPDIFKLSAQALLQTASRESGTADQTGRGWINGDMAFRHLSNNHVTSKEK